MLSRTFALSLICLGCFACKGLDKLEAAFFAEPGATATILPNVFQVSPVTAFAVSAHVPIPSGRTASRYEWTFDAGISPLTASTADNTVNIKVAPEAVSGTLDLRVVLNDLSVLRFPDIPYS